ncbi:MAG: ATP synthase F0 subunit A [Bacteroidetes bacterium]|nr:MAG: ATP synthase F0 subunit A [Bacteroidota bacterium]
MGDKSISKQYFPLATLLLFFLFLGTTLLAQHHESKVDENWKEEALQQDFKAGDMIIEHITDSYEWHILTWNKTHVSIYLPVILYDQGEWHVFSSKHLHHGEAPYQGYHVAKEGFNGGKLVRTDTEGNEIRPDYDISITKNVLAIFISIFLLMWIFISVANSYKKRKGHAPKGMQSLLEPLILFVRDDIAKASIGHNYEKYTPYLLTIFFFIFFNNLFGIIPFFPGGANVTGNIGVTGVMAAFTFIITTFSANKNYWVHIINMPGVPWWLKLPLPLMPIVEIMGMFTKPFVLMVRLFANMTAGHIIVLGFVSLIFIFGHIAPVAGYGVSVVSVAFSIFMDILEVLVALIQAYVFTILSALYFGMATEEAH